MGMLRGFTKKDNLTDVVERLPKPVVTEKPNTGPSNNEAKPEKPAPQQVVNSSGETITLGQKPAER